MNKLFEHDFTGDQLSDFIHEKFPDSFGLEIYKEIADFSRAVVPADWNSRIYKTAGRYSPEIFGKNDNRKLRLYWPERMMETYSRFRPRFEVDSGDENTYVHFMLEDEKSDNFIATWGYKRCEVERNYLFEFLEELYK